MSEHAVRVAFDEFGWTALSEEAERQGVTVDELVRHAVLYFLSDVDSGRAAARVPDAPGGRFTRRDEDR